MFQSIYILDVLIILVSAICAVSLFRVLKLSSIVGYLIAGLVIGPYALKFINDVERIQVLAEFGVVFLLFTIGLKMPMRRFQVLKKYVFGLGFAQVGLSLVCFAFIAHMMDQDIIPAILIGAGLALSSTAVALQILAEQGELSQKYGRVSFAILLLQDLVVVLLLTFVSTLGHQDKSIIDIVSSSLLKAGFVLGAIILIGRLVLSPVYKFVAKLANAEIFMAISFLVVLVTSVATDAVGLSKELGAFLAGLLLAETEYRHQVEADIQPFYGLLLGLFFMSIGMSIDLNLVFDNAGAIFFVLGTMMFVKAIIIFGLCKAFSISTYTTIRVAMLLAAGGEFVFILLKPAVLQGYLHDDTAQVIFMAVAISMALSPFMAAWGKRLGDKFLDAEAEAKISRSKDELDDLREHIIIAGYGRVGKIVGRVLTERMIPFVAIDHDMTRVTEGRSHDVSVFYGDVTRDRVLKSLGAQKASALVISLHNQKAALKCALMARRKFPKLLVAVRMDDDVYEKKLIEAGAMVIKPEQLEPSLKLVAAALTAAGTNDDEVDRILDSYRKRFGQALGS